MKRRVLCILTAAGSIGIFGGFSTARESQSYCRHSELEEIMLEYARAIAAGTDSIAVNRRASLHLVQVPGSEVYAVTSDSVCELAARAHATRAAKDTVPVDLVRVGPTRYMLIGSEVSKYGVNYFIYDGSFAFLTSF
jgi:hypothetical protein